MNVCINVYMNICINVYINVYKLMCKNLEYISLLQSRAMLAEPSKIGRM
jgi:hypothetical protein